MTTTRHAITVLQAAGYDPTAAPPNTHRTIIPDWHAEQDANIKAAVDRMLWDNRAFRFADAVALKPDAFVRAEAIEEKELVNG